MSRILGKLYFFTKLSTSILLFAIVILLIFFFLKSFFNQNYSYEEILDKVDNFTYNHFWKENDFIILDNKRFLHGRKSLVEGDPRDIVVVQSRKASFGYGSTTRKSIQEIR